MKKELTGGLILGMILLSGNAFGQTKQIDSEQIKSDRATEQTYFDLLVNLVSTNLNYGKSNSALHEYKKTNQGVQAGVSFQAGITPRVSLVSELYFIMKGGELKAGNPLTANKTTLRFYELELPVLARFHFGKFYVNAGPSIACNLFGTRKMEGTSAALLFNSSSEAFKRLDAGIQMGAGYRFKVKQKSLALDVRYTDGLTNISHGPEMYNRYLNISLRVSKPWKANPLGRNKNSR